MDENTIVLWDQDGVETTFEKVFSIEIEGEHYMMLSPVQTKFYRDEDDDDEEILVFKLKDSDHGELLVHLKEDECRELTAKCKDLIQRFVNNYED
ncbi:DUF1292 domain-containing protein [Intestinibacter bartlettii]|uniref:DUF1292 domain-containing protein n=1 Tax=Intestinibacter bartlettii TaxID=261299 RepID=A0ABS6DYZ5_9FIRM|nr:DUF1292 domain-containing protein [Intestinibacter bartlettii]MBU5336764.1 DUF1292 domain-containing protein [Intestinibacter bartlettii]MDO5011667.1 DUF1292 domain-containing protein [Intestinibacter bartlettii]